MPALLAYQVHLVLGSSQTHNLSSDGHRLRSKVYIDYHTIMVTTSVRNQNLSKFKDQLCYLKSKLVTKFSLVEVLWCISLAHFHSTVLYKMQDKQKISSLSILVFFN